MVWRDTNVGTVPNIKKVMFLNTPLRIVTFGGWIMLNCYGIQYVLILFLTLAIPVSAQAHNQNLINIPLRVLNDLEDCSAKDRISDVEFSPDDKYVVATWKRGTARICNTQTGEVSNTLFHGTVNNEVTHVIFSLDGKYVATSDDTEAMVWDAQTGAKVRTISISKADPAYGIQLIFLTDSNFLITGTYEGAVLWNISSGQKVRSFPGIVDFGTSQPVQLSKDQKYLITVTSDTLETILWDVQTGNKIHIFPDTFEGIFTLDNHSILIDGNDGLVLYDIKTLKPRYTLRKKQDLRHWSFSFDSRLLLLSNDDPEPSSNITLWDITDGSKRLTLNENDRLDPF